MVGLDNPLHLALLLVILLLVFGAKRLPEMGRSLGSGLRGFKESISAEGTEPAHGDDEPAPAPPADLPAARRQPAPAELSDPGARPAA